jgi:transposase InsO family protein
MNISRRPTLIRQGTTPATGRVLRRPRQHHAAAPVADCLSAAHKRDYARVNPRPDAISVLQQLPKWFEDYNTIHPHSGLRMRSPREFIALQSANQAACPV